MTRGAFRRGDLLRTGIGRDGFCVPRTIHIKTFLRRARGGCRQAHVFETAYRDRVTGPLEMEERMNRARAWFASRQRTPFDFQEEMWSAVWRGESGLLNAGTGTGKTLAAWLGCLLDTDPDPSRLGVRVLWLTPLRALARDLASALKEPLRFLRSSWQVEQRTGDTSSASRARQRKRPPEGLVTTPESLSLLLSHADAVEHLRTVQTVIVDEWHEFLGTKRGVQTELLVARLRALNPNVRIWALSATLPDLPLAMQTLLGPGRSGRVIRAPDLKRYAIDAIIPSSVARFPRAGHIGLVLLPEVIERIAQARTTLVFTNTRSQAEIWFQAILTARLDWLEVTALHHGSIDAKIRRRVEEGLKLGKLRCVVCTSSLDLGVDFPPVDQVLQIGSPKGVARLLQRAGRSGHQPGEISRATIVPTHAFELLECAAARHAVEAQVLEPRKGLTLALDVLAQHLVTLAAGEGFVAAVLEAEVRGTHAFATMNHEQWLWVLDFITRGGAALQGYAQFRRVEERLGRYEIAGVDLARRHRRAIGTITSNATFAVKWLQGGTLGQIEESFISRMRPGAVFVFAGRALQLVRLRDSVAYVRISQLKSRFVPRWQGARLPLSTTLGQGLLDVLADYAGGRVRDPEVVALAPLLELQQAWSAIPKRDEFLVEQHTTREGFHLFVFPFAGRLLNEGVASLMSSRIAAVQPRTFSITSNEYGFELLCEDPFEVSEDLLREWAGLLLLLEDVSASVSVSDLARRQFRDIARIAGLIDPGMPRQAKSARQLQMSSGLMFDVLERHDPHNLLLLQSRREVLEAQLDYRELELVLQRMHGLRWRVEQPRALTPLSFPLWADRLQTQILSTETWQSRVEREARRLEKIAR